MEAFLQEIPSCLRVRQRHFVLTTQARSCCSRLARACQTALAGQSSRADQGCLAIGEASRCRAPDWRAAVAAINKSAKRPTKLRRSLFMGTSLFSFVRLRICSHGAFTPGNFRMDWKHKSRIGKREREVDKSLVASRKPRLHLQPVV